MSRVVVYECCPGLEPSALSLLRNEGLNIVSCQDGKTLLEEIVQNKPNVVIYAMKCGDPSDLGVLRLLRRASPDVPLVLLARDGSLSTQRLVQSLRPIYYAVYPLEPNELREAVRAALARPGRDRSKANSGGRS